jgi:hypothetical protein
LYGDAALGNRLLGWGTFRGLRRLSTVGAREILAELLIYANGRVPTNAEWLVDLSGVELAHPNDGLELLDGEIEASGKPLTLEHLPASAARALVYYRRRKR